MKSWSWILLIIAAIAIKWISLYPDWVEDNYTYGLYPLIAKVQRVLFGWLPFSIGDLFYIFLILVVIVKTVQFFRLLFKKKLNRKYFIAGLQQIIFFFLFLYVIFNLFWGLNYNRKGIAYQLDLQMKQYDIEELDSVTTIIENRLNEYAALIDQKQVDSFKNKKFLFNECMDAYKQAAEKYPFLNYNNPSVKPSMFSYVGNYLGFQGYYSPFSGEAQVNTQFLPFLEPYVTAHEMGHQLGYAKENEANFVGYLACKSSPSNVLRYSTYFDLYNYAIAEVWNRDSLMAKDFQKKLHPQVVKDRKDLKEFYKNHKNPIEPIISWVYGQYLKANNQPEGKMSYNAVVGWLIAYMKKYGKENL